MIIFSFEIDIMSISRNKRLLKRVGKKFALLRQKSDMPFSEISRATELSVYKLKRFEAGEYDIFIDELFRLCEYYMVHPADMIK